jgi:hypothetical protein
MDPRENERKSTEQERRAAPEEPGRGAGRAGPGASTPLESDDIVESAPAKREQRDRRLEEQEAEGGHLASGIGDDRPPRRDDEP